MDRACLSSLIHWKDMPGRKPLLVRGARQVGKTYSVETFGKAHFENTVSINFELQPIFKNCFVDLDPLKIVDAISILSQQTIIPGKTLLFLDEIQACPQAIVALRYFKEKFQNLHVIAAGSLLEFALRSENLSMPVGRIDSLYVKPLSFKEYLKVRGYPQLLDRLHQIQLNEDLNSAVFMQTEALLREYFVTGGMPETVADFIEHKQLNRCQRIQASILETYRNDFGKYARESRHKYLEKMVEKAPGMIATQFRYSIVDPHMKSRDLKYALSDLTDAGLIYPVHSTAAAGLPLSAQINEKKFKLLFLDIGLVQQANGLEAELFLNKDLMQINHGQLVEQFVGQELLAYGPDYQRTALFYWDRDKPGSTAEVDYIINIGDTIIPIEVKAGKTGSLKSLHSFMQLKRSPLGVRLSMKPLALMNNVLSVPLFMVHELPRLIKLVLQP